MTTPPGSDKPSLADTAAEPAEESVTKENDVVGDATDSGSTVPTDGAQ